MNAMRYRDVLVRTGRLGAASLIVGVLSSGCFFEQPRPRRTVEVEPEPTLPSTTPAPAPSKLIVRWSIDGKRDPNECVKSTASDIEVSVFDGGREIGAWRQRCDSFAVSINLNSGNYSASAVLLDAYKRPRTTSVTIDPFTLRGNDTLEVPVNFPASSFLQQ
jgi:hypothetical protein